MATLGIGLGGCGPTSSLTGVVGLGTRSKPVRSFRGWPWSPSFTFAPDREPYGLKWIGGGLITVRWPCLPPLSPGWGRLGILGSHLRHQRHQHAPSDVFGRLMILRDDPAGTEVMAYVVWMFMLIGCWLAVQRAASPATDGRPPKLGGGHSRRPGLLVASCSPAATGKGLSWASLPEWVFLVPVFLPMLLLGAANGKEARRSMDLSQSHLHAVGRCLCAGRVRFDHRCVDYPSLSAFCLCRCIERTARSKRGRGRRQA